MPHSIELDTVFESNLDPLRFSFNDNVPQKAPVQKTFSDVDERFVTVTGGLRRQALSPVQSEHDLNNRSQTSLHNPNPKLATVRQRSYDTHAKDASLDTAVTSDAASIRAESRFHDAASIKGDVKESSTSKTLSQDDVFREFYRREQRGHVIRPVHRVSTDGRDADDSEDSDADMRSILTASTSRSRSYRGGAGGVFMDARSDRNGYTVNGPSRNPNGAQIRKRSDTAGKESDRSLPSYLNEPYQGFQSPVSMDTRSMASHRLYRDDQPVFTPASFFKSVRNEAADAMSVTSSKMSSYPEHFPDLSLVKPGQPTSFTLPDSHVRRDFEFSTKKLMNVGVFEQLLQDPMGRFRFQQYLEGTGDVAGLQKLAVINDTHAMRDNIERTRAIALAIHRAYLSPSAEAASHFDQEKREMALNSLRVLMNVASPFDMICSQAINELYRKQFSAFIRVKIAENAKVRLSSVIGGEDRGDLGEVFCVTNPRLPDHPIVLCSDAFCKMTGYTREMIIGRNCRFLQGKETAPESVQKLRDALNAGEPCVELLLNYRRDSTPFWNLLSMIPLRDTAGRVEYYIGAQITVTGCLASKSSLSYLIGASTDRNFGAEEDEFADTLKNASRVSKLTPEVAQIAARQLGIDPSQLSMGEADSAVMRKAGRTAAGQKEDYAVVGPNGAITNGTLSPNPTASLGRRLRDKLWGSKYSHFEHFNQRIGGAESHLSNAPLPIEEHASRFEQVYSNLLLFRRDSKRIIFLSKALLVTLGYPMSSPKHEYASSLLGKDFLSLIDTGDKTSTKHLRDALRVAIDRSVPYTCSVGMALSSKAQKRARRNAATIESRARPDDLGSSAFRDVGIKRGTLHLTPCELRQSRLPLPIKLQ
ncbi:hypothetical protein IE53DRAFT_411053 [Violaceomyces palustris]|uniref:Uncharacterized protein n=1 Tax=Violaceomyces palustris TaxID=1673888 RepID=A0ACD0NWP5_9BASI|nr:hypothetical protein IE53DRAFT_411053 [Violaceomyces palustris]